MSAFKKFNALYEVIEKEIPYSDDYNDFNGYYKPLVEEDLSLEAGESIKLTTPTGKRVIVTKTMHHHNVVIFQRHANQPLLLCTYHHSFGFKAKYKMWEPLNNKMFDYLINFLATEVPL